MVGEPRQVRAAMASRELPEIRYLSKSRQIEKELRKSASEQDKKSSVRKRQIDRDIYLTTKVCNWRMG